MTMNHVRHLHFTGCMIRHCVVGSSEELNLQDDLKFYLEKVSEAAELNPITSIIVCIEYT